jgi:xylulokinase
VRVWRHPLDDALEQVAEDLSGRHVPALGLAGRMHGQVLVDAAGAVLRPALL